MLKLGAGSSVGFFVFAKLLKRKQQFYPIGLVRDAKGANVLYKLGAQQDQVKIADITKKEELSGICNDCKKVVLCTSARPQKKLIRKIKDFFKRLVGLDKLEAEKQYIKEKYDWLQ